MLNSSTLCKKNQAKISTWQIENWNDKWCSLQKRILCKQPAQIQKYCIENLSHISIRAAISPSFSLSIRTFFNATISSDLVSRARSAWTTGNSLSTEHFKWSDICKNQSVVSNMNDLHTMPYVPSPMRLSFSNSLTLLQLPNWTRVKRWREKWTFRVSR